ALFHPKHPHLHSTRQYGLYVGVATRLKPEQGEQRGSSRVITQSLGCIAIAEALTRYAELKWLFIQRTKALRRWAIKKKRLEVLVTKAIRAPITAAKIKTSPFIHVTAETQQTSTSIASQVQVHVPTQAVVL
ncbi:hypothetical protein WG66_003242, partial [Moniliophthora roreri]